MTKKNKHISEKDYQRYLKNQMTDAERNAFERELQKNPFEAEALEGFQQISPDDLANDLFELHSKIALKKQKLRYRYWAVAATILLLVTSGILWFQLKDETPVPVITENKTVTKADTAAESRITPTQKSTVAKDITINSIEYDSAETENKAEESKEQEIKVAKAPPVPKTETLNIIDNSFNIQSELEIETPSQNPIADMKFTDMVEDQTSVGKISLMEIAETESEEIKTVDSALGSLPMKQNNFVKASVVSDEQVIESFVSDDLSKPAFAQMELNPTFQATDTIRMLGGDQSQSITGSIRIRGVAESVVKSTITSSSIVESDLHPVFGMEEFEKYLDEKAILTEEYSKSREVVKLIVQFDEYGNANQFTNLNKADSTVFEMAKSIIKDGPKWSPEIRNGKPVTSEKELKIVFRKKK